MGTGATFTMRLKDVIEDLYGTSMSPEDYEQSYEEVTFNDVIYGELPTLPDEGILLGIGGYPIFDPAYRKVLNGKIIDRYYNREIGMETIEMFRLSIRRKMNEIMPLYNQLYKSTLIEYSPLMTMDIHSVGSTSMTGEETGMAINVSTTDTDSESRAVSSETPQTMLAGMEDYATNASDVNSQSDVSTNGTSNTNANSQSDTDSDTRVTGYQGAASDLIMKFRASFLNIDTAILEDIQSCFMLVFDNGDAYSKRRAYYPHYGRI